MKAFKNFSKKADIIGKKLSAAAIGAFASGMVAGDAFAQGGLNEIVEDTGNSLENIPGLIQGVIYIGGAVFVASGVLSLKAHVDNPSGQTGIRQGLVRLVAGAFLLAAPAAFEALTESVGVDDEASFGLQGSFEDIDL